MSYKIAVSADGDKLDDIVDVLGRCKYFIISEIENDAIKSYTSLPNPGKNQSQGSGIGAAQTAANQNIEAVITTRVGITAHNIMQQASINTYIAAGEVEDAIMDYIHGNLKLAGGGFSMTGNCGLGGGQGGQGGRGSGYGKGQGCQGGRCSGRGQGSGYGSGQGSQGGRGLGRFPQVG